MSLSSTCPHCGYKVLGGWTVCLACRTPVTPVDAVARVMSTRPAGRWAGSAPAAGHADTADTADTAGIADGAWTPPPPAWPAPQTPAGRSRRVIGAVAGVAVLAGAAAFVLIDRGSPYPEHWDARVEPLVAFVESARGLEFEHPVEVEFLTPEQYTERRTVAEEDLSAEERETYANAEAMLRAVGLGQGNVGVLDSANTLVDDGTLAFYDPGDGGGDERIVVRGTEMTVSFRVTLVHELTHALQDQHFGVRVDHPEPSSGEEFAYRALVEGDANRIEQAYYRDRLSDAERQEAEAAEAADAATAATDEDPFADVPPPMLALFGAPYTLGGPFVELLDVQGGNGAVDEAFAVPPVSEEHLFDPFTYLDDDAPRFLVAEAPDGAEFVEEGEFGVVSWFIMLAEHVDPHVALTAADGWGGDGYIAYKDGDDLCVRLEWEGDTAADVDEMHGALTAWAAAVPSLAASVSRSGDRITVQSCDPGDGAEIAVTGTSLSAMNYPALRSMIAASVIRDGGLSRNAARCTSDTLARTFTLDELTSDQLPPGYEQRVIDAVAGCA